MIVKFMKVSTYIRFLVPLVLISLVNRLFLPSGIDYICFILFLIVGIGRSTFHNKSQELFKTEKLVCVLLCIYVINYIISPYKCPVYLFFFGSFVTIMPFLISLVTLGVNTDLNGILRVSDVFIKLGILLSLFMIIETATVAVEFDGYAIVKTGVFMGGYVTSYLSFCIMLCFANFYLTNKKTYFRYAVFLLIIIFLSMQFKAIAGACIFAICYILMLRNIRKSLRIAMATITVMLGGLIMTTATVFQTKMDDYLGLYATEDAIDGTARTVLYAKSFDMASDYFPLGTGQGTFGSIPAKMTRSKVYDDYGLSGVYGLDFDGPINFMMDTHWASVLGEQGVLGTLLYLSLMLMPLYRYRKCKIYDPFVNKYVKYILYTTFIVLLIESIALPLPNRMAFMFIYAGLCTLLTNNSFIDTINNNYNESTINQ